MIRIELEADSVALQLAIDEAMLLAAQHGELESCVRTWSFPRPVVILGRSSKAEQEVDLAFCRAHGIPILRRCTGGASVVGGPGCLMYSVVYSDVDFAEGASIDGAHRLVMERLRRAVQIQQPEVSLQGICDLTWQSKKFSGNALRVTKRHVLYHGTLLIEADLSLIAGCLGVAPRQPEYRAGRDHRDFLVNLPLDVERFQSDFADQWRAETRAAPGAVMERAQKLFHERYDRDSWTFRH